MKRFFSVFLAAVLLMVLAVPASAAESYIWDEAGLLTEEGRAELNETAREISERTGCAAPEAPPGERRARRGSSILRIFNQHRGSFVNFVLFLLFGHRFTPPPSSCRFPLYKFGPQSPLSTRGATPE